MGRKDRFVIAIDGPAASGKSSVAAAVAERIGGLMFDTGAVYRALTLAALERDIALDDAENLARLVDQVDIAVRPASRQDGRQYDVVLDERDVTWNVREQRVDRAVSPVSAHSAVRKALLDLQRRIGNSGRVVMPGRDIGTIVMPDADLKIWLDASLQERVARRQNELKERGVQVDPDALRQEMQSRDRADASREASPMEPAIDAVVIQTDGRTIDEVVELILASAERTSLVCLQNRGDGGE